jgi:hypothetical protein
MYIHAARVPFWYDQQSQFSGLEACGGREVAVYKAFTDKTRKDPETKQQKCQTIIWSFYYTLLLQYAYHGFYNPSSNMGWRSFCIQD